MIFAVFAENAEQLYHTLILAESIRTFAGKYAGDPIWIYLPESLLDMGEGVLEKLSSLDVEIKRSHTPPEALAFYYAAKVFAAAKAEAAAEGKAEFLVWMDEDTIVLREPADFNLERGMTFGYRPVMHRLIGSLYSEPPDDFWSSLYDKLSVPESSIFPMVTPADQKTIRPYFNAGLLVVQPEREILRRWSQGFQKLYQDPNIVKLCQGDRYRKIFLHQAALAAVVLSLLKPEEMIELSAGVNYPLFFKEMFGAQKEFDTITDVLTFRYDVYFRNPAPDWSQKLKGPPHIVSWLKERLDKR
jgi:hypothetical protein